ncbi:MAG TPA: AI-2E family transporter [Acidimicrobiia bacterium]|nr:AI-2E family transporter [Acidimicrobiia bacterium]
MATERVVVVVRPRAILLVVGLALMALAALVMLDAAAEVVQRVLVAGVLACLLRPLTLRLARRMPLGAAAVLTVGVVLIGFAILTAVELRDLVSETNRLKEAVPARIEELRLDLEPEHPVRHFIEENRVESRVREWLGQLPARVVLGTDNPGEGASRVTGALLVTILTMFTITRGAQSIEGGLALIRHQRLRAALERMVVAAYRGGKAYTVRTLGLAVASGVVAGTVAEALDVPAPSVLGLWVGLWSLIPVLGLVIGYLPVIGLAAAEDTGKGAVALVILVAWLVLAALARRRWIATHSVDLSRLLLTLSVMTGLHVGRVTGAVVGVFLAAAIGAALAEARRLNATGELSQGLDQLFTLTPPLPPLPPTASPPVAPPAGPAPA